MINYKENVNITSNQLDQLYSSVGWTSYTENIERLQLAINNSLYTITAWNNDELVGLIRVIGDDATIIYIQDILVNSSFQNKGIGGNLIEKTLTCFKSVRQKVLLTNESESIRYFYEKHGFISCDNGQLVAFYKEY